MTREVLIENLQLIQHCGRVDNDISVSKTDKDSFVSKTIATAIETIEEPPCEDCVSREAVKKQFEEVVHNNGSATEFLVRLWKLPSVTPRPTGKWIKMPLIEAGQTYSHECSLCGRRILITDVGLSEFPYCHCGARMQKVRSKE